MIKTAVTLMTLLLLCCLSMVAAGPVSDEELYDQVRIRIANDRMVGGGHIQVKVTNGVVELTGTVKQEKQRAQVEKVAKKVKGVKSVENKLRIVPE